MRRVSSSDLLAGGPPEVDSVMEGPDLQRLYWTLKQQAKDLARRERYWASMNDALRSAFEELEALHQQLADANAGLERRVAEQVVEIMRHAGEVDVLSSQLTARVRERSRELRLALERMGAGASDASELSPGTVVGGRARIVAKLGEGAMGSVYEAEDLLTNRRVAMKLLRAIGHDVLRRFIAEAEAASAVNHPSIVRVLHVDATEDGTLYQLMELVRGVTLRRRAECGRISMGDAARVVACVAEGLAVAHAEGVVHRDMKPENILLSSESPGVRVLDFGIAKHLSGETETAAGTIGTVGTPGYMSPDQIRPAERITPAADVYSLGVVLFELVAGRRPFVRARIEDVLVAHLYAPPPPLGGPPELSSVVAACLEKSPSARPTAAEVERSLRAFADAAGAPPAEQVCLRATELVAARSATPS